jgi:hypothetical protein
MAKGVIPLQSFRKAFGRTDRRTIRRVLLEAFAREIKREDV